MGGGVLLRLSEKVTDGLKVCEEQWRDYLAAHRGSPLVFA